jgi:hypothetical protein
MIYNFNKFCNASQLETEINSSAITIAVDSVSTSETTTIVSMKANLSESEQATLSSIVNTHEPVEAVFTQEVKLLDTEVDSEGRQIIRAAAGKKGWSYHALGVEFATSTQNSLHCKDVNDNNIQTITVKYYNSNNNELTIQSEIDTECVKTVLIIAPQYDYEVISGNIRQLSTPSTNIRMWVQAGILELGGAYVKTFVDNLNLKYMANMPIETDGRASKYMTKTIPGVPYQGNQFRFTFKHDVGVKHDLLVTIETFRA